MKINFAHQLVALLNGQSLKIRGDDGEQDLTLRLAAVEALLGGSLNETPDDKARAYKIAQKIVEAGEEPADLTPEEISVVKAKIGAMYGPAVVGPAFDILNG